MEYRKIHSGITVFGTIWFGQLVSTLGSGLTSFALGVWVYEQTGSATLFAINLLVWILPNLLISPFAGVMADRYDRRLVMIFSDTGAGLSSLFIALVLLTGDLQIWQVYLATFFNSAFSAFQWPAYSAATSLLVPKKHLGRASGMVQMGQAISQLATPAAAGALFVTVGLKSILLIDVFTYLVALVTLIAVRFPQPETPADQEEKEQSLWRDALFGWQYIRARVGLFGLLCVFALMNFLVNTCFTLLTPMLLDMAEPDVVGLVSSVGGVGMLVGTILMSVWGGPKRRVYGILAAEALVGFGLVLTGIRPSIPLIAAAGFFLMLSLPVSNGSSQAIWQTKVEPGVQGRVFAIRSMIAYSVIPLSTILAGPLADRVFEPLISAGGQLAATVGPLIGTGPGRGIGLMFVIAGILYMGLAMVILLAPRIRRLELEIPDAVGDLGDELIDE